MKLNKIDQEAKKLLVLGLPFLYSPLASCQDVVYCPRCDLEGDGRRVPCIQDGDHMARCEVCLFVFCGKCRAVPRREP